MNVENLLSQSVISKGLGIKQHLKENEHYSTSGMISTLLFNILFFFIFLAIFEWSRHYKQIYLKRLLKRFQITNRVPPEPQESIFGWFISIYDITESQVLEMVGLDAYMLLRYHTICLKFAIFLSFWGLLVLTPVYSTSAISQNWEHYTIMNVLHGSEAAKYRLWVAAAFGYIMSAYFCQLLFAEYNNFAFKRMQFLFQSEADVGRDPDTPQQTYYSVMVERIPGRLRSAKKLYEYFNKLFPGEVYTVEVALDLQLLIGLCRERRAVRDRLEQAIAVYEASGKRPLVGLTSLDLSSPSALLASLQSLGQDSLSLLARRLVQLNTHVQEAQTSTLESLHSTDTKLQTRLVNKHDTRAAVMLETLASGLGRDRDIPLSSPLEAFLFGPPPVELKTAAREEMDKADENMRDEREEGRDRRASQADLTPPTLNPLHPDSLPLPLDPALLANYSPLVDMAGWALEDQEKEKELKERGKERAPLKRQNSPHSQPSLSPFSPPSSSEDSFISVDLDTETSSSDPSLSRLPNSASSRLLPNDLFFENARLAYKEGLAQTKIAGSGALRGVIEMERLIEMVTLGAYYKYSSTAFVTFKSRVTENISHQLLLSHDELEIQHAPNPHDLIWENVPIPRSQVALRTFITDIGLVVGSIFWSSLVTSVDSLSAGLNIPRYQQQFLSVIIMLFCLLVLPVIFDALSRYYEGLKSESEIQNSIMARYFYYQLINVYVTVGFGGLDIWDQILTILRSPKTLVDIVGRSVPVVSLFFCNLVIVKIFAAIPIEMLRPYQLTTITLMSNFMDKRKTTRRDMRTGAFFSWPMLYGWVYPQLMMVLMIMATYACIAPLLMPFCILFFAFSYIMYKYQLLYVYINDDQSGGFMWYAVFSRSLIALLIASFILLGYLGLQLKETYFAGPFYFLLPLPLCILYFWHYCDAKFRKQSMNLSFDFAKKLDEQNSERQQSNQSTPLDKFKKTLYRQPSLTEDSIFPEPYRRTDDDGESNLEAGWKDKRRGSVSINVHELFDEGEEDHHVLESYFKTYVIPLANEGVPSEERIVN